MPQSRVDLTGRIVAVNRALEVLLDQPASELVGRDGLALYVEQDRPALEQALAELASGAVHYVQQERTLSLHHGRQVRIALTATTCCDDDGRPLLACSAQDVTLLRQAQEATAELAGSFEALLAAMPVAVFTWDRQGTCTSSRGSLLARLGFTEGELVGDDLFARYGDHPSGAMLRAAAEGQEGYLEAEVAGRVLQTHYRPLHDADRVVVGGVGITLDVTERAVAEREVRANDRRVRALLRHAAEVVLVLDRRGALLYVSPSVTQHFGYDDGSVLHARGAAYDHPDDRGLVDRAWARVLARPGAVERFESRVRHADGTWRWTEHVFTNLLEDPDVGGVVVNLRDLSEKRRTELELEHRSLHDALTGLAGRGLLLDRISSALAAGRRHGRTTGLVLLDVVGMGALNARHGQLAGDAVLRAVAERLQETVRETDVVGRVGGDEFAVLVEDVASLEELRVRASELAEALGQPVPVGEAAVDVALRAAATVSPVRDAGALLAAAEQLLAGRGPGDRRRRAVVGPGGDASSAAARDLARAVEQGELRLHLQPVVQVDGPVVGAEALVRWQHPERGLLPPSAFVPLAESSGVVVALGEWVLREACTHAARWQAAGLDYEVAVNLSPLQTAGGGIVDVVRAVLAETGLSPQRLVLEVTESALMDDPGAADVLQVLRDLDVRLALDDFGTGYSSLTYLKRFPVDAIKVDRSFVSGLGRDADDEAIVASVVSLGRAIGKTVVAEGVETVAQLDVLRSLGVDRAQGFLWAPGLPAEQLDRWLALQAGRPTAPAAARAPSAPAQPQDDDARQMLLLHKQGASLHTIAAALNAEGRRTPDGRRWTTTTVARVIAGLVRARP